MASRLFIDANVLLDLTLKRPGFEEVKKMFEKALVGELLLFTSTSVLHITGYWLTKAYGIKTAKKILLGLLKEITIVDCSHEVSVMAIHSQFDDIEDSLQYYTALHHKLSYFISGDRGLKKFALPQLPVVSVGELMLM